MCSLCTFRRGAQSKRERERSRPLVCAMLPDFTAHSTSPTMYSIESPSLYSSLTNIYIYIRNLSSPRNLFYNKQTERERETMFSSTHTASRLLIFMGEGLRARAMHTTAEAEASFSKLMRARSKRANCVHLVYREMRLEFCHQILFRFFCERHSRATRIRLHSTTRLARMAYAVYFVLN